MNDQKGHEPVPVADPAADLAGLREDILAVVARVIDAGAYILGPEVGRFEQRIAGRLGATGSVGVGSGTDALVLAMLALGVAPGDEVITVSHTAGATVAAILMIGAVPVLIDVEPDTCCLDPARLGSALGPRTRAVIAVHLYGHPADLAAICEFGRGHGIAVIEDCAQAHDATIDGRPVGSIGDVGCFSFYPTKNLGAIGDGGIVASSRPEVVTRLRQLRTYGWTKPQFATVPGGRCSRLDELQAAILQVKLDHLDESIERRRAIARFYDEAFVDLPIVRPMERAGCRHVYHLYVIRCEARDLLAAHLESLSIMTGRHYPFPVHRQPGMADFARVAGSLAVTDKVCDEILTLPLYPSMPAEKQGRVVDAVRLFFGRS